MLFLVLGLVVCLTKASPAQVEVPRVPATVVAGSDFSIFTPGSGKAAFYLGMCFKSRNNWRLAQRNFEEALQHLGPADESLRKETMHILAVGYAETGELDRAIDLGCELANLDYSYKNIGAMLEDWQAKAAK